MSEETGLTLRETDIDGLLAQQWQAAIECRASTVRQRRCCRCGSRAARSRLTLVAQVRAFFCGVCR